MLKTKSTVQGTVIDIPQCPIPMKVVRIPEGPVVMGTSDLQVMILESEPDWPREERFSNFFRDEQPQHTLHLPAFSIGLSLVTNAQYLEYVIATGADFPRVWRGLTYPEGQAEYPVSALPWPSAQGYCKWLAEVCNLPVRLPTEAEWERAARGEDDRFYPWGNEFNPYRINSAESYTRGTTPVFLHSPASDSPWGVAGMSGNVWEWTSSAFMPYPYDPADGREDQSTRVARTVRGGAWMYSRRLARCSAREGLLPDVKSPTVGFRVALSEKA